MGTLSVQLYSVRDQLAADQQATLNRLAEMGFRHVEPFGLGSLNRTQEERLDAARKLRAALDAAGLSVSAVHAGLGGSVAELAAECEIVGVDTVFIPHPRQLPGFDADDFGNASRVDAFADALNALLPDATAHGLRLGYHNHWFEWAPLPGENTGWDRFWSRADENLLAEVDLYWATAGGADAAVVLEKLGERVHAVHIKDGPAKPGEPQTPLGTGMVDNPALLHGAPRIGWHVAEIDTTDLDAYELLAANTDSLVRSGLSSWS